MTTKCADCGIQVDDFQRVAGIVVCFQCAHRWTMCEDCGKAAVLYDNDNIHTCAAS